MGDLLGVERGEDGVDAEEVGEVGSGGRVVGDARERVSRGAADLGGNGVRVVVEEEDVLRGGSRFAHFDGAVGERGNARSRVEERSRKREESSRIAAVEGRGKIAHQLQMLALVFAHRDARSSKEKDVGCLEDRIGKESKSVRARRKTRFVLVVSHAM